MSDRRALRVWADDRPRGRGHGVGEALVGEFGRAFLYARYDPDLTREGLDALGFRKLSPEAMAKMDSVKAVEDLMAIGKAYARKSVDIAAQWGAFGSPAAA